jgi:ankyrin repeat protein
MSLKKLITEEDNISVNSDTNNKIKTPAKLKKLKIIHKQIKKLKKMKKVIKKMIKKKIKKLDNQETTDEESSNGEISDGEISDEKTIEESSNEDIILDMNNIDDEDNNQWKEKKSDYSQIYKAIKNNCLEKIKEIINNDTSELNKHYENENLEHETPLITAVKHKNIEIVKLLLEYKPDMDLQNDEGFTAFHIAVDMNLPKIIKLLINHTQDFSITDYNDYTILNSACVNENIEVIKYILHNTEDPKSMINFKNISGDTSLHSAVFIGDNEEIVKLLLKYNANLKIKNTEEKTALDIALSSKKSKFAKLLLNYNENINNNNSMLNL